MKGVFQLNFRTLRLFVGEDEDIEEVEESVVAEAHFPAVPLEVNNCPCCLMFLV